jgi:hypothetical protein
MAPRFQPILIDPDEVRAQLDQIEVERKPVVEDPVRREQLRRVQRHAEDAVRYAELALRLVGREPRNR